MTEQKPLTGAPICTHCDGNYPAEVIHDRENSPVEYHCGCGNYAVVGMPARWPFMVAKKAEQKKKKAVPETKAPAAETQTRTVTGIPATEQCQQVMQQSVPLFTIFLDPELLDALTEAAKKAYRTPELHAAYLIDKAVRGME